MAKNFSSEMPLGRPSWDRDDEETRPNWISWHLRRSAARWLGAGPLRPMRGPADSNGAVRRFGAAGQEHEALSAATLHPGYPPSIRGWDQTTACTPERDAFEAEDVSLYDDDGVIFRPRNRAAFVETLDYWHRSPHEHPVFARPRLPPAVELPGTSAFVGGLGGQTWFHFLLESLPKLALIRETGVRLDRIIVQSHFESNKEDWLRRAGCMLPIEWLRPLGHLRCERLLFCGRVSERYRVNPWTVETLRSLVGARHERRQPSRWIWAYRGPGRVRAVSWEDQLVEKLPPPWEAVEFARLKSDAVVRMMGEATGLAGLHGAGLTHLALMPGGSVSLEFLSRPNYAWYPSLAFTRGIDHRVHFVDEGSCDAVVRTLATTADELSASRTG